MNILDFIKMQNLIYAGDIIEGILIMTLPVDIEIFNKTILTVSSAFVRTEIIEDKKINLEIKKNLEISTI